MCRRRIVNRYISSKVFLLLILTLTATSFIIKVTADVVEKEQEKEQVCTEQDKTCQANNASVDEMIEPIGAEDQKDDSNNSNDDDDDDDDDDDEDDDNNNDKDEDEDDYYNDDDYDDDYDHEDNFAPEKSDDPCKDTDERCFGWANAGECDANPGYMKRYCQLSCKVCELSEDFKYGSKQLTNGDDEKVLTLISEMKTYMQEEIIDNPDLNYLEQRCKNRHAECAYWALEGECDANPGYMLTNCAPVCKTCHFLDFKVRCPLDPDEPNALEEGELEKMFEGIVDNDSYNTTILSRPSHANEEDKENADYKIGPWVIIIDDFIKDEECDKLIELGGLLGYERSEDVGKELFDGSYDSVQSSARTSYNAWCQDECYEDPMAQNVAARIETLTGVPEKNSENLQLLKYDVGQFYRTHHDFIDNQEDFPSGSRILTAFLYLNDVEGGGGTDFPKLKITVMPKKGRLLLWPSVRNNNPNLIDHRTTHQALPVEKGVKYAANAWLHMRDFKGPNSRNCS